MITEFLPAERLSPDKIIEQNRLVVNEQIFREIIEKLPYPVLILNSLRQIIYFNDALIDSYPDLKGKSLLGQRPGEIFRCEHSLQNEGCGTTKFCRTCGAAKAIVSSLKGVNDIEECRIRTYDDQAYDFRVWTYPKIINNERFVIFTLIDISHEKRREILERVFYHDILNTVNGILGYLKMYKDAYTKDKDELVDSALKFTKILIDEINSQRIITLAESGELVLEISNFNLTELVTEILELFELQQNFKNISVIKDIPDFLEVRTDKTILRRIIINLYKNALEASTNGSVITIKAHKKIQTTIIQIKNEGVMPEEVKLQIFKRSFSTKGRGRGLGTYSIKLLTEKFLKGNVHFISEDNFGTEFTISIPDLAENIQ